MSDLLKDVLGRVEEKKPEDPKAPPAPGQTMQETKKAVLERGSSWDEQVKAWKQRG